MRKMAAVLAVVVLLALSQAANAADVEAGWYVKLGLVALHGWDGMQERVVDWDFVGELGTYGPFEVSSPDPLWPQRVVSVPTDAYGMPPGTSVLLWGEPVEPIEFVVDGVSPYWDTFYDASEMRLELLMYREDTGYTLLWTQTESGYYGGAGNVLTQLQTIPVGYVPVFRVTTVPEPSSLLSLSLGLLLGSISVRRKIKR